MTALHQKRLRLTLAEIERALKHVSSLGAVKALTAIQHLLEGASVARAAAASSLPILTLKKYIRFLRSGSMEELLAQLTPQRVRPMQIVRPLRDAQLRDLAKPRQGDLARSRKRPEATIALSLTPDEVLRAKATLKKVRPRITENPAARKLAALDAVLGGASLDSAAQEARLSARTLRLALQEVLMGRPEAAFAEAKFSPVGRLRKSRRRRGRNA